jgi:hypothetical protein
VDPDLYLGGYGFGSETGDTGTLYQKSSKKLQKISNSIDGNYDIKKTLLVKKDPDPNPGPKLGRKWDPDPDPKKMFRIHNTGVNSIQGTF